jgi:hypothetical protein
MGSLALWMGLWDSSMRSPFFIFYFILLMQAGKCLPPYSLVLRRHGNGGGLFARLQKSFLST